MAGIPGADLLQKILLLTSNVEGLKNDMAQLRAMVMDHHERIIRLEGSADLIAEKAKNAALGAVVAVTGELQKDMAKMQANLPVPKKQA